MMNGLVGPFGLSLCVGVVQGVALLDLDLVGLPDALRCFRAGPKLATGALMLLLWRIPAE